jgi:2-dehydro-3-deoxy-L-rhamnonate dehydrogenase (NAD+)
MEGSMDQRFTGKTAVISGGASGIGQAIARRITNEGGQAVVFDLDPQGLEKARQEGMTSISVDVGNEESVKAGITQVIELFGRVDIVVNSAGIVGPTSTRIVDYRSEDFGRVLQVNLFGSFYMVRHSLPPMLARGYGRILLLSSMAGKDGNPGMVGYSTSKAGVIGLVKAVGKEYAESGITINAIAPAVIRTPMNERTSPEQLQYLTERIPMKRLGTVEEAAGLACWIVSEEASFTTGFVFDLSGGRATY